MAPPTETLRKSTHSFRKRFFLFFASALFLLLLSVSLTIYFTLFDQLKKAENNSIAHFAEIQSMAVTEWCRRAKGLAKQITSRTRIREELEKYNRGKIDLNQFIEFTKPKLQDAMNLSSEMAGIIRLDKKKQVVVTCGHASNFSLKNGALNYVFADIELSAPILAGDRSFIVVSAPIINRIGERQGTDLVFMDLELLRGIVTNSNKAGKTMKTMVGYRSENSISDLFPSPTEQSAISGGSGLNTAVKNCVSAAVEGKSGWVGVEDMVIAYQPIQECNWGLVIYQNRMELYLPIYKKMALIGGLSLVVYFMILIGFWLLLKPLAGRIVMHADELEKKIQDKTSSLEREILERKKIDELRAMAAGRAEISAMMLHHIGNAITPVKVYVEEMVDESRDTSLDYLEKVYLDFLEHRDALQVYLNEDERGRRVFDYMKALIASLKRQRDGRRNAVQHIDLAVVRITEMLNDQQRYVDNGTGLEEIGHGHPRSNEEYKHGS